MHAFDRFQSDGLTYEILWIPWADGPGAHDAFREIFFPLLRNWLLDRMDGVDKGMSDDLYQEIAYKGFLSDQWEAIRDDDFREMFWKV